MNEIASFRKSRICLEDYNYKKDIENRLFMSHLTTFDLHVLEEILYSPLKLSLNALSRSLEVEVARLLPSLEKFSESGLLELYGEEVHVDKEMRKYYEGEILKFEEEFVPGMEYLQCLLRKVPIHILPIWYAIPRTSNHIFHSLVEKYLATPQVYQRHLQEVHAQDPLLGAMIDCVFNAEDYKISSREMRETLGLSEEEFTENMLYLEFNFVCCLGYEKSDQEWREVVTPFREWRDYLRFLRDTELPSLPVDSPATQITQDHPSAFAFIEGMRALLAQATRSPLPLSDLKEKKASLMGEKLLLLKLAEAEEGSLVPLEGAQEWLRMPLEEAALFVYRHPFNRPSLSGIPEELWTEKNLREVERCLQRVPPHSWAHFDDFLKGALAAFDKESQVALKRNGKSWKYALPEYSEAERALMHTAIFRWLGEVGLIARGSDGEKEYFRITPLGCTLFGCG